MTWTVVVRRSARSDLAAAIEWYEAEAPTQLTRLSKDIDAAINRIAFRPLTPATFHRGLRRVSLQTFPYQVWYLAEAESKMIQIVAVIHHRQDARRLLRRVDE